MSGNILRRGLIATSRPVTGDEVARAIRHGVRGLARARSSTVSSVLSLALSMAGSIALFGIVASVYLSAVPFNRPSELVVLRQRTSGDQCVDLCLLWLTRRDAETLAARTPDALGVALITTVTQTIEVDGLREPTSFAVATGNLFNVLGTHQEIGRTLVPADDSAGSAGVAVLSDEFWHRRFNGDSTILGHFVRIGRNQFQIVGVLPRNVPVGRPLFGDDSSAAPFFVSAGPFLARNSSYHFATAVARLRTSASRSQLRRELQAFLAERSSVEADLSAQGRRNHPPEYAEILSLHDALARSYSASYPLLLAVMLVLQLMAFGNIAALNLARLRSRNVEYAIRLSLGATRRDLILPSLVEGALVSVFAGAIGTLVASWIVQLRVTVPSISKPFWHPVGVGWAGIKFACLLSLTAVVVSTALPALFFVGSRTAASRALTLGTGRGTGRARVESTLLGVQIACTSLLLPVAGMLLLTFRASLREDLGQAKHSVIRLSLDAGASAPESAVAQAELLERLAAGIRNLSGVQSVAIVSADLGEPPVGLAVEGREGNLDEARLSVIGYSADYFQTIGTRLIAGRAFLELDDSLGAQVAILDSATAAHMFPVGSAVGRRIKLGSLSKGSPWITVVGVAARVNEFRTRPAGRFTPQIYRPLAQVRAFGSGWRGSDLVARTSGSPQRLLPEVRASILAIAPSAAISLGSIDDRVELEYAPLRLNALAASAAAGLAAVLAVLGIYAAASNTVISRRREIGTVRALGAGVPQVVALVARRILPEVVTGLTCGVLLAVWIGTLLRAVLYGISPTSSIILAGSVVFLVLVIVLASAPSILRALRVPPAEVLRAL